MTDRLQCLQLTREIANKHAIKAGIKAEENFIRHASPHNFHVGQ